MIKLLIEYKVDIYKRYSFRDPLHIALRNKDVNFEIIELLLPDNYILDESENNNSSLHVLLKNSDLLSIDRIKFLINRRADVNKCGDFNYGVLDEALDNKDVSSEIIEYIIKQKVDINREISYDGELNYSIFFACETGSYEKDGQRVYTTDVVVENFDFLESRQQRQQAQAQSQPYFPDDTSYASSPVEENANEDFDSEPILDISSDDLPF